MKPLIKALKSFYEFFAGDWILLSAVTLAFGLAIVLADWIKASNGVVALVFVGCLAAGLFSTVFREFGKASFRSRKKR